MNQELEDLLLSEFNAKSIAGEEVIQNLWSNYGQILRVYLNGGDVDSVIVKNITSNKIGSHPRGWDTDISHQRKVKSYEVETYWYQHWANQCSNESRIPKCYLVQPTVEGRVIVMEDLDASGYPVRKSYLSIPEAKLCLEWLANFHATFLNTKPKGLWEVGTYWHLATRPDELGAMENGLLKDKASTIDQLLSNCNYQTIVHGDAKVANFCFDETGEKVAAVDFQYVGGGCGMKDVVYLLGSCLTENECKQYEEELLNYYFKKLELTLIDIDNPKHFNELETEWRKMYAVAWADFTRFLLGWAPAHQKLNGYSLKMVQKALSLFISSK